MVAGALGLVRWRRMSIRRDEIRGTRRSRHRGRFGHRPRLRLRLRARGRESGDRGSRRERRRRDRRARFGSRGKRAGAGIGCRCAGRGRCRCRAIVETLGARRHAGDGCGPLVRRYREHHRSARLGRGAARQPGRHLAVGACGSALGCAARNAVRSLRSLRTRAGGRPQQLGLHRVEGRRDRAHAHHGARLRRRRRARELRGPRCDRHADAGASVRPQRRCGGGARAGVRASPDAAAGRARGSGGSGAVSRQRRCEFPITGTVLAADGGWLAA